MQKISQRATTPVSRKALYGGTLTREVIRLTALDHNINENGEYNAPDGYVIDCK